MNRLFVLFIGVIILFSTNCLKLKQASSHHKNRNHNDESLNGVWNPSDNQLITVTFQDSLIRVSGCNANICHFQSTESQFRLNDDCYSTKMFCMKDYDQKYLDLFRSALSYEKDQDGNLIFKDRDGNSAIKLIKNKDLSSQKSQN